MVTESNDKLAGLELLRQPFPANQISKLPKPTKQQTEEVKHDYTKGTRCKTCGGWHHPNVIHLDYVGHAALTDRLLDCDPSWTWEPFAITERGLPAFDETGGLWIKLTVCGQTRIGYGHAANKNNSDPGAREKEVIGDALRNAAMRFGAALDLWHKGDLHADEEKLEAPKEPDPFEPTEDDLTAKYQACLAKIETLKTEDEIKAFRESDVVPIWKHLSGPERDTITKNVSEQSELIRRGEAA